MGNTCFHVSTLLLYMVHVELDFELDLELVLQLVLQLVLEFVFLELDFEYN